MSKLVQKFQGEDIKINFKYRNKTTKELINIDELDDLVVIIYSSAGEEVKRFSTHTGSYADHCASGSYTKLTKITETEYYGWIESGETINVQPGILKSESKIFQYYPELSQSMLDTIATADICELKKVKCIKYVE